MDVARSKRFAQLHRRLTNVERKELKASIEADGVRDALVVMQGTNVLVDGYNRLDICEELGIADYPVRSQAFANEDAAEDWILRNQLARRNLSPKDFKLTLGRLYNRQKQAKGGDDKRAKGKAIADVGDPNRQFDGLVNSAEKLAKISGVSPRSVERSGKYAEAFDSLSETVQRQIQNFPDAASERAVVKLATLPPADQQRIAREVRVGHASSFDAAIGLKPENGQIKSKKVVELSCAKLVDYLILKHLSPLVRGIDQVAAVNGGKGRCHTRANDALSELNAALKEMRSGKQ